MSEKIIVGGVDEVLEAAMADVEAAVAAVEAALAAPTLLKAIQTSGTIATGPGKLWFAIWAGAGGGPEPYFRLSDGGAQFLNMYGELKKAYIIAPAIPIPFAGALTVSTDARSACFGYTLD